MATVTTIPTDITNLKKEITSIKSDVAKKLESAGGTITGDLTVVGGISGELSGNAATATKLKTARKINSVSFDGSKDINLTPEDIGALPITGGTLTGGLTADGEIVSRSGNGFRIVQGNYGFFIRNDGSNTYFMLTNSGDSLGTWNSLRPLIINDASGAVTIGNGLMVNGSLSLGTANALGGNSIVLGDNDTGFKQNGDGILDVYANSQRVFRFQNGVAIAFKNIQAGDSKKFSLSSSNTSTKNITFNLWGASTRPVVAELGDEAGWHFYSQRNTDNSVIFAVNGQMQPSNWGNFDSRYVKDVRLGTRVVQLMERGGRYEKAGHTITGLRIIGEVDGDDEAIFRPIQKYINGTWYNVAQV
ncbi:TPA: phage tail protein [Shigella flexneri]